MLPRSQRPQNDQSLRRHSLPDAAKAIGQATRADRFFRTVHAISLEAHEDPIAVALSGANVPGDTTACRTSSLFTPSRNPHSILGYDHANFRICIELKCSCRGVGGIASSLSEGTD